MINNILDLLYIFYNGENFKTEIFEAEFEKLSLVNQGLGQVELLHEKSLQRLSVAADCVMRSTSGSTMDSHQKVSTTACSNACVCVHVRMKE